MKAQTTKTYQLPPHGKRTIKSRRGVRSYLQAKYRK